MRRTYVDVSRQIYSLLPLTARPPLRAKAAGAKRRRNMSFPTLVNNSARRPSALTRRLNCCPNGCRATVRPRAPRARPRARPAASGSTAARRGGRAGQPAPALLPAAGHGGGPAGRRASAPSAPDLAIERCRPERMGADPAPDEPHQGLALNVGPLPERDLAEVGDAERSVGPGARPAQRPAQPGCDPAHRRRPRRRRRCIVPQRR